METGAAGSHDELRATARVDPGRLALEGPTGPASHGRWNWEELDAWVDSLVGGLVGSGVRPGGRVAAVLPPGPASVGLFHAARRVGAALVPLNPSWTETEIERALEAVRPVALVIASEREAEDLAVAAAPSGERGAGGGLTAELSRGRTSGRTEETPAVILLTSGSTGASRPVAISQENLTAAATAAIDRLGLRAEDRWLLVLSPAHVGGLALIHRSAIVGSMLVTRPSFRADEVADLLDEGGVTHVSMVPVMLGRLIEARGDRRAPSTLRCLLVGGGEASGPLVERALALGYPIALTYGLTEATSQVATATPDEVRERPGSVGRAVPGVELAIRPVEVVEAVEGGGQEGASARSASDRHRERDEEADRTEGEILVRGAMVAVGAPSLTVGDGPSGDGKEVGVDEEGWLHTGDLGRLEEGGFLRVIGRLSERIVTAGVTVDPGEVEAVLVDHPAVLEVGIVGVPDREWGERIVAAVVARSPESTPTLEDLLTFARARLAPAKRPRQLLVVADLPRNDNGKLSRAALRQLVRTAFP